VCRLKRFDDDVFEKLICRGCNRTVHKFCYAPDIKEKKLFKCDECKKSAEGRCDICYKNNGILKEVGNNHWSHVSCALASSYIKVISYKNLDFKMNSSKRKKADKKCMLCKRAGT
jgi:hypothetical protein